MSVIRVMILADTRLYREGLAQMLARTGHLEVVASVARCEEALAGIAAGAPDMILLDLGLPDCIATIGAIRDAAPEVAIVALSLSETKGNFLACAEVGVAGYVSSDASVEDLVRVVQSVKRGEALCSPRITGMLLRRVAALSAGLAPQPLLVSLTRREREIIRLVARGLANKEIAQSLGIEVATVKNHVHSILGKLKVRRRGEAAARIRIPERLSTNDSAPA